MAQNDWQTSVLGGAEAIPQKNIFRVGNSQKSTPPPLMEPSMRFLLFFHYFLINSLTPHFFLFSI